MSFSRELPQLLDRILSQIVSLYDKNDLFTLTGSDLVNQAYNLFSNEFCCKSVSAFLLVEGEW